MKKLLTSIVFAFIVSNAAAQTETKPFTKERDVLDKLNYYITYQLVWQPAKDTSTTKTENMVLLVGDSTSLFRSRNNYVRDSITSRFDRKNASSTEIQKLAFSLPRSDINYVLVKEKSAKKTVYHELVGIDRLNYEEPIFNMTWNITSETALKSGYQCQKATTTYGGRDYDAWFTYQLPISDGPYKFGGLPGLIVAISDTQQHYNFTLIGFEKKTQEKISVNSGRKLSVSRKKFEEMKAEDKENPTKAFQQLGEGKVVKMLNPDGTEASDKEFAKWLKSFAKNKDNTIELEN